MKKAVGSLRLDLAQYREMEIFTQFSSDLDDATKKQLVYGEGLMMLLRQPNSHPFKLHEQVIILIAAIGHVMVDIPVDKVLDFRDYMLNKFNQEEMALCSNIDERGAFSEEEQKEIITRASEYCDEFIDALGTDE